MSIVGRDLIAYLSIKYNGDWNSIYKAVKNKELVDADEVNNVVMNCLTKCNFVTIIDSGYPDSLKKIYKPPFVLFYKGNKENLYKQSVAILGDDVPTRYTHEMTTRVVNDLINNNIAVISMLDSYTHLGVQVQNMVIAKNGSSIALSAGGIDYIPDGAEAIYDAIIKNNILVSEYPPGVKPDSEQTKWSYRMVVGLANATFVAKAKAKGDTLIAVGYTLYIGRTVYVLPQPVKTNDANNKLIADGATLVESGEDIFKAEFNKPVEEEVTPEDEVDNDHPTNA